MDQGKSKINDIACAEYFFLKILLNDVLEAVQSSTGTNGSKR